MDYAWMLPIQPKWVDMIRSGVKEYEFRPYKLEVGAKVYIYESKGKRKKGQCIGSCDSYSETMDYCPFANLWYDENLYEHVTCKKGLSSIYDVLEYEGAGAIVGSFVVEECYETHWRSFGEAEPMEVHFEKQFINGTNFYKLKKHLANLTIMMDYLILVTTVKNTQSKYHN